MKTAANLFMTAVLILAAPFLWFWAVLRLTCAFLLAWGAQVIDVWS